MINKIILGPTGKTCQGHVLDVNKKFLERRLQQYDRQLYLVWNPLKRDGYGTWELRRRPENKTAVFLGIWEGNPVYELRNVEDYQINHVKDFEYLDYRILDWVKQSDTWLLQNYGLDNMEYAYERDLISKENRARDELKYQLKHNKKYVQIFKDAVQNGYRPEDFFKGIYDKDHERSVYNDPKYKKF